MRFFYRGLSIILLCLLSSVSVFSSGNEIKLKKYKVASEFNHAPFAFIDSDGKLSGVSVDILSSAASHMGLDIEIFDFPDEVSIEKIKKGEIDAVFGLYHSSKMDSDYVFSVPFMKVSPAIFIRKGIKKISEVSELEGKDVAFNNENLVHDYLSANNFLCNPHFSNSTEDALLSLNKGEFDYAIADRIEGEEIIRRMSLNNVYPLDIPIPVINISILSTKSNSDFIAAMSKSILLLSAKGELDDIKHKWSISEHKESSGKIIFFSVIFLFLLLVLVLSIITVKMLRKQVENRTKALITELSERKKAENELKKSESMFRTVWENSFDPMRLMDKNGLMIGVNDAFCRMFRKKREELINYNFTIIHANPDFETMQAHMKERFNMRGTLPLYEAEITMWTGEIKWFELSNSYLTLPDGEVLLLSVFRDITEKKNAELKLKYANRLYAFLSAVNMAIVKIQEKQKLLDEICRIAVAEGQLIGAWFGILREGERKIEVISKDGCLNEYLDALSMSLDDENFCQGPVVQAIRSGGHVCIDNTSKFDKNKYRNVAVQNKIASIAAFPVKYSEKTKAVLVFYTRESGFFNNAEIKLLNEVADDLSLGIQSIDTANAKAGFEIKLRQSEKYYKGLFEKSSDAAIISDLETGKILDANVKACEVYGYPLEEMRKMSVLEFVEDPEKTRIRMKEIDKNRSDLTFESVHHDKYGNKLIFEVSTSMVSFNDENAVLAILRDIAQWKKTEETLHQAKEEAEKSNRLKSNFLAQMSHEIRTPINTMLSFISLIRYDLEGQLSPDLKDGFDVINQGGGRLIRTIDLILNMSEIQAGSYEPNFTRQDISHSILRNLIPEFKVSAQLKNIALVYSDNSDRKEVLADTYTVTQIFVNLIENAIKFTKKGKVEVTVYNDADGAVCVDVRDTGIGISHEYIDALFTPFSQEDAGYTRRFEGNGLGLALAKNYCDLNNAEIKLQSVKGEGSVFTVVFKNSADVHCSTNVNM